ncbi:MAG: hypothetical protein HZB76_01390 [Chlamydiae bacterium]|nr:hypothetical protein [Chlamydiota bacterium]
MNNKIKKTFFAASSLAILSLAILFCNLFFLNKKDYEEFEKMLSQINSVHTKSQNAYQKRDIVQKDIWIGEKLAQRHIKINSDSSKLFLTLKKDKIDLLETLQGIECFVQDKINPALTSQHFRYFKAKSGSYLFRSHKFIANDTSMYFFKLAESDLPLEVDLQKAYMQGTAKELSFLLSEKKPCFNVLEFKATIYPQRGQP